MFKILGLLFLFFISILVLGLAMLSRILRTLFGFGGSRRSTSETTYHQTNPKQDSSHNESPENRRKKIFSEDEGEYIDFEEVK